MIGEGNVVRGRALAGLGDGDGVVGDISRLVALLIGDLRDLELGILHGNRRVAARLRVRLVGCGNHYVADGRSRERGVGDGDGVVDEHGRLAFLAKGVCPLLGLLAEAIERALGRVADEIAIRLYRERGLLPVGANHAAVGDVVALGIPNLDAVLLQFNSLRLQKVGNDQVAPDCPRRVVRHLHAEGHKVANVAGALRCGLLDLQSWLVQPGQRTVARVGRIVSAHGRRVFDLPPRDGVLGVARAGDGDGHMRGKVAYGCCESGPRRLCRAGDFPLLKLAGGQPFGSYLMGNALRDARDVDRELACVCPPDFEPLGKALVAYDYVVRNGALLRVLDGYRVYDRSRILLGCSNEVLVAIGGLLDGEARRVRPNLGGIGRFLAVVRAGCGDVHLLGAVACLGGDRREAYGERVPVVELVKRAAPTVALDARGGEAFKPCDLHRFGDKLKPFGKAVGEDGLAALGVFLALREGGGEADHLAFFVFVGICSFVDGEPRRDEGRLDAVARIGSLVIDAGVGAVRHGERAVGRVLGELSLELEAVRLALHAHGMLQIALRECEFNGVSVPALVSSACVDYLARVLDQLSLAVGKIAAPVDVAHLAGKHVDNLEVGVGVAVSAGRATLVHGNLDGVGNHVAD